MVFSNMLVAIFQGVVFFLNYLRNGRFVECRVTLRAGPKPIPQVPRVWSPIRTEPPHFLVLSGLAVIQPKRRISAKASFPNAGATTAKVPLHFR